MKPEVAALARHRLTRAREALREADILIEQQAWRGAINRYYYAAFHAARALLTTREADSARHAGVIALFQEHFVRPGGFPLDLARALPRAFEKRLSSDDADFVDTTGAETARVQVDVRAFVEMCGKALEQLLTAPESASEKADSTPRPR